ncbi:MAG: NADPH:quinone reductase [Verrucomicrobia bacterium]|nr:NADPH:quinone reductase [Verrucomicrobiota bacterium]
MRAAFYQQQGHPEVLEIGSVEDVCPGPGEVRVKLAASGANPSDVIRRAGRSGPMGFPRIIPHSDGAGTIDAVGTDLPSNLLGCRVWIYNAQWLRPFGTAADYVCVPVPQAVPLPNSVDFLTGATLGIPACTAHRCIFSDGPVTGLNVLVVGGAGVVGHYAIQFAKWGGATVLTTVGSDEQAALAREAGADHIINYKTESFGPRVMDLTEGRGVNRIAELDFGANLNANLSVLAPNGVIAAYYNRSIPEPVFPFLPLMLKSVSLRFVLVYLLPPEARRQAVDDITQILQTGALRPHIGHIYPLEEIAQAHSDLENGRLTGNCIIRL